MNSNGRKIIVTRHAVETYSRRLKTYSQRPSDSRSLKALAEVDWKIDDLRQAGYSQEDSETLLRYYRELEREIRDCVSSALRDGLSFDHKPKGFVLYRRRSDTLPPGQRFVLCDLDSDYGFIVKRHPHGEDVVVTTLTRVGARR